MLDEAIKQSLQKMLQEKTEMLLFEREERNRLDKQIRENELLIDSIKRLLGEESPEASEKVERLANQRDVPIEPRPGTVTDEIRRLFEENPKVTSEEAIHAIRSKFPNSKIGSQSFSIWNGYFKKGKYRMDKERYYERYGENPPYE